MILVNNVAMRREYVATIWTRREVLTLPNLISFLRLLAVPLFVWYLFVWDHRAAAGWILGVLGMTDWVDGYLARRFDQVSELGKMLDPIADRAALIVGIGSILIDGSAPLWLGVAVLAREVFVAIATLTLAALGAGRIDVTWWGKGGTFGLYFAFPFFLGSESTLSYADFVGVLAWIFAIPSLIAAYYSLVQYIPLGLNALREGRSTAATSE